MTNVEVLANVKIGLGNIPTHLDSTIQTFINETIEYMLGAGVDPSLLDTSEGGAIDSRCVGCITRGVADLWNYGNSDTKLSEYFYQRCGQLRLLEVVATE